MTILSTYYPTLGIITNAAKPPRKQTDRTRKIEVVITSLSAQIPGEIYRFMKKTQ
jgi:hypothetical protein